MFKKGLAHRPYYMVSVPIFPDTHVSFLFYGFRAKKSWIVTCNYHVPSQAT